MTGHFLASESYSFLPDLCSLGSPHGESSTNTSDWSGGVRVSVWPPHDIPRMPSSPPLSPAAAAAAEETVPYEPLRKTQSDPKWVWRAWIEEAPPIAPKTMWLPSLLLLCWRREREREKNVALSECEHRLVFCSFHRALYGRGRAPRLITFGDRVPGDRCATVRREDGQTWGWQKRSDDHQPPLRARLSAGRGIRRPPRRRGDLQDGCPSSLQDPGRGGGGTDGGEEAPAQAQLETPLRGDGDPGERHLRESEEGGGESEPEDGEWIIISHNVKYTTCVIKQAADGAQCAEWRTCSDPHKSCR